jgi:hypothetical protein
MLHGRFAKMVSVIVPGSNARNRQI